MMKENPQMQDIHYGIYIPANVKMDLKISAMAKLLYGEILALAQLDGVCESNNRYFADIYNIKKHKVYQLLRDLQWAGYLEVERDRDPLTGAILRRRLIPLVWPPKEG